MLLMFRVGNRIRTCDIAFAELGLNQLGDTYMCGKGGIPTHAAISIRSNAFQVHPLKALEYLTKFIYL
jgi:hypothetical protein